MEALNGMGMHGLNLQGIEGLELPASIQSGLIQHFESLEQHQQNQQHMHQHVYHLDSEHVPQQILVHDSQQHLAYLPNIQPVQQDDKQEQWYAQNYLPYVMHQLQGVQQGGQQPQQQQQQQQLLQGPQQQQLGQVQMPQTTTGVSDSAQPRRSTSDRRSRNQGPKSRQSYSLEFKLRAIECYDRMQAISPAATAMGLPKKGGRKMLRDWVKNRDKINEKFQEDSGTANPHELRKMHPGKKPTLTEEQEQGIQDWYENEKRNGRTVSNKEIAEKAREIANMENFKASSRWMMRFKRKVGLPTHGKQEKKRARSSHDEDGGLGGEGDTSDQSQPLFAIAPQHLLVGDVDQLGSDPNMYIHISQGMYPQEEPGMQYVHSMPGTLIQEYPRHYPVTSVGAPMYETEPGGTIHVSVQDMPIHVHLPSHQILVHHSQPSQSQMIGHPQMGAHQVMLGPYPNSHDELSQYHTAGMQPQLHSTSDDQQQEPSSSFQSKTVAV